MNLKFISSNLTYFRRKSAFSTEIPFPVKTIARSCDISSGTKMLHNTYFLVGLV